MAVISPHSAFVHIPKTGGNFVRLCLAENDLELREANEGPDGRTPTQAHQSHRALAAYPDLFSYSFVRNPYQWYRSAFCYRQQRGWPQHGRGMDLDACKSDSFAEFVFGACEAFPGFLTQLYEQMIGNPIAVDYLGRTETLREDLCEALTLAGEAFDVASIMDRTKSNTAGALGKFDEVILTTEIKERIYDSENTSFDRYGYPQ